MQITPPPMPKSQYGLFYEVPPSEFDDEGYQEFIDEPGYTSAQLTARDQQWLAIVKEAVEREREACAAAADNFLTQGRSPLGHSVAAAIRSRSTA
jgi:hypothetical protein